MQDLDIQLKVKAAVENIKAITGLRTSVEDINKQISKKSPNEQAKALKQIVSFNDRLKVSVNRVKEVSKSIQGFGNGIKGAGRQLTGLSNLLVSAFGVKATANFIRQEKAIAQVEAGIKSTGNAAGLTSKQLQDMASDLQGISTFGDEEILENVTAQFQTFTNISGDVFAEAQKQTLNISERMGTDLKSSAIQLGKALNDPITGISALSRVGITFNDSQKDTIKSLVQTGKAAEAQTIILKELEKQFGGSAEAARDTFGGSLNALSNTFGDALEEIGGVIADTLEPIIPTIQRMVEAFKNASPFVKRFVVVVGGIAAAIGPVLVVVGSLISAFGTVVGALGPVISVVTSAVATFGAWATTAAAVVVALKAFFALAIVALFVKIVAEAVKIVRLFGDWDLAFEAFAINARLAWLKLLRGIITFDYGAVFDSLETAIINAFVNARRFISDKFAAFASLLGFGKAKPEPVVLGVDTSTIVGEIDFLERRLRNLQDTAVARGTGSLGAVTPPPVVNPETGRTEIPRDNQAAQEVDQAALKRQREAARKRAQETKKARDLEIRAFRDFNQSIVDDSRKVVVEAEIDAEKARRNLTGSALRDALDSINTSARDSLVALNGQLREASRQFPASIGQLGTTIATEIGTAETAIDGIAPALTPVQRELDSLGQVARDSLTSSFTSGFSSIINGTAGVSDAFQGMVQSIISSLSSAALNSAIRSVVSALGGAVGGTPANSPVPTATARTGGLLERGALLPRFNTGGRIQSFPQGFLRGPGSGTSDSIQARVSSGEFVQRAAAVRKFGVGFMDAINNLDSGKALSILSKQTRGFNTGGVIGSLGKFERRLNSVKLPRFETGGVVSGNQTFSSGDMNVAINVENSGTAKSATVTDQQFDGRNLIVSILLDDIRSNGDVSKGLSSAFNLRRGGR